MHLFEHGPKYSKKLVSITVVVLIHALLIYVLINGMGQQTISVIEGKRIKAILIEEIKPSILPAPIAPPSPPVLPIPIVSPSPPKRVISSKPSVPNPEVSIRQPVAVNDIQLAENLPSPQSDGQVLTPLVIEPTKGPSVTRAVVDFTSCDKPNYPLNSLRNEEQGKVQMEFLIDLDGRVADSRIIKSSGFRMLDAAAKKALSLCQFIPGSRDGKPQQSWAVVNYVWTLPE